MRGKHAYHGRTHLPAGSDPIPGLFTNIGGGFYDLSKAGGNPTSAGPTTFTIQVDLASGNSGVEQLDYDIGDHTALVPLEAGIYAFHATIAFTKHAGGSYSAGNIATCGIGTNRELYGYSDYGVAIERARFDLSVESTVSLPTLIRYMNPTPTLGTYNDVEITAALEAGVAATDISGQLFIQRIS